MAYNRAAPKKQQNETLAVAAICLILGYLACWCIQVPEKPKVRSLAGYHGAWGRVGRGEGVKKRIEYVREWCWDCIVNLPCLGRKCCIFSERLAVRSRTKMAVSELCCPADQGCLEELYSIFAAVRDSRKLAK